MEGAPNLVVTGLGKSFGGVRALDGVDFSVAAGEVHGLLGQNGSGKSTLVKILGGVYDPDPGGRISVGGRELPLPLPPGEFSRYGVAIVHQSLGLVSALSVTENLFVRRLVRSKRLWINWPRARRDARALFESYGLAFDPRGLVSDLAPIERALLAIVRAFHEIDENGGTDRALLVLDEPTPFLSRADVERLFDLVRAVAARGASVIFVSHDVDEVLELTDRVTVLRNGRIAASLTTREASKGDIISAIVGRRLETVASSPRTFSGAPNVTISGLVGPGLTSLDLSVNAGEIVGLTGLIGSGYDRVPYLTYGAETASAGRLAFGGETALDLASVTPRRAFEMGMILIPADRQAAGVIDSLPVAENVAQPMLGRAISRWLVTQNSVRRLAEGVVRRFDVRPADPTLPVRALSGGNQQKVLVGKWLQADPRLLLLDEPTQGVDVGAREQVYEIIRVAAKRGASVLCASSDHEQLAAICDRVLVFSRGSVTASLVGRSVTKEAIAERCFHSLEGWLAAPTAGAAA
ncbi:MAG: sugar ABC transporter ATP-binding protein [Roseiarcus sp.]